MFSLALIFTSARLPWRYSGLYSFRTGPSHVNIVRFLRLESGRPICLRHLNQTHLEDVWKKSSSYVAKQEVLKIGLLPLL